MDCAVEKVRPTLSGGGGARWQITEEELLGDLVRVAREVGRSSLSQREYSERGRYSFVNICRRFGSWKSALLRVGLEPAHLMNISPEELVADIRRVLVEVAGESGKELGAELGVVQLRANEYTARGKYSRKIVERLFGRWESACEAAGLVPVIRRPLGERDLFLDFKAVWERLGRRPVYEDLGAGGAGGSRFGAVAYTNRFGTFSRFVKVFLEWQAGIYEERVEARRGPRTVNLRLRFAVLNRDRFRCCACGRSPATDAGVRLQVDHVVPWSRGGETVLGNLQTLCWECNIGKSDRRLESADGRTRDAERGEGGILIKKIL